MKIKRCFFRGIIPLLLFLLVACSDRDQQLAKEIKILQSKAIQLPSKGLVVQQNTELHEVDVNEKV